MEVCLTPDLIHQHRLEGKLVVVVDIFRATSCIVTGLAGSHIQAIRPVSTVEECLSYGQKGYIMAGERGGIQVDGFDMGNSPLEYARLGKNSAIDTSQKVAITTTNGSTAILKSLAAREIIIGAFLNLRAVADYIIVQSRQHPLRKDDSTTGGGVLIHCAGWEGRPNLEDTLFAGALIDACAGTQGLEACGDSALLARELYRAQTSHHLQNACVNPDLRPVALESDHGKRLVRLGHADDVHFCMERDKYDIVPKLNGEGEIAVAPTG